MFARFHPFPVVPSRMVWRCCGLLLVAGALAFQAEPALAQKAKFDVRKPHVNVSGDEVDPPSIVELVVVKVGDDGSPGFLSVGEVVLLEERSDDARYDVAIVTADGVAFARLQDFDGSIDRASAEDADRSASEATLVTFDNLTGEAAVPLYGYIRIKKLNSGG